MAIDYYSTVIFSKVIYFYAWLFFFLVPDFLFFLHDFFFFFFAGFLNFFFLCPIFFLPALFPLCWILLFIYFLAGFFFGGGEGLALILHRNNTWCEWRNNRVLDSNIWMEMSRRWRHRPVCSVQLKSECICGLQNHKMPKWNHWTKTQTDISPFCGVVTQNVS